MEIVTSVVKRKRRNKIILSILILKSYKKVEEKERNKIGFNHTYTVMFMFPPLSSFLLHSLKKNYIEI